MLLSCFASNRRAQNRWVLRDPEGRLLPLVGGWLTILLLLVLSGCMHPIPLDQPRVLGEVAARYRHHFPGADPDPDRNAGLLRPRFGLPALVEAGAAFPIELLAQNAGQLQAALLSPGLSDAQAARCLGPEPRVVVTGCYPLQLRRVDSRPIGGTFNRDRLLAQPERTPPLGDYDLYCSSAFDAPMRAPRAVWTYPDDPTGARQLRVAQLSDLHVGKGSQDKLLANLARVIDRTNALAPDLVLVTGDLVNVGDHQELMQRAREVLLAIDAPLLVIPGNHDLGFGLSTLLNERYGAGWHHFAQSFHSSLLYKVSFGGWDFIGFDSGASVVSPLIQTRGLAPGTIDELRHMMAAARREQRRGVVLFTHAPLRTRLLSRGDKGGRGLFGGMRKGADALENLLVEHVRAGQRAVFLAGHTHWSDVFELHVASQQANEPAAVFTRWPRRNVGPVLRPVRGLAALVNVQSASHSTWPLRVNGQGYGLARLELDGQTRIAFERFVGNRWQTE